MGFDDKPLVGRRLAPFDVERATASPTCISSSMQGADGYWENQGGKKLRREDAPSCFRALPGARWVSSVFDVENDGDMDIFITDMHSDMSEESSCPRYGGGEAQGGT